MGEAGAKDLKIKTSQPGTFAKALEHDILNEGGRFPITIPLSDLDAGAILAHVELLRTRPPRYQLARNNCSHVVIQCLRAGQARKPGFVPHAGAYSRLGRVLGLGIWTPDQVLRYARELAQA